MTDVLTLLTGMAVALLAVWQQQNPCIADDLPFWRQDTSRDDEPKPWERLILNKKNQASAPEPDPNIGKAAMKQAELGEDYLAMMREQYGVANARQAEQDKLAKQVTEQQLAAAEQAQGWATDDRARYEDTFLPLQDEFIDKAKNWDSKENQEKSAAEAKADVLNNSNQQRQVAERNMASMGVDPTSGRFAGVERAGAQGTALAAAGAENNARNTVRNQGLALQADAINLGNGLAVNPAASLGLSSASGQAAMQTTSANNAQSAGNASIMGQGYQAAMAGYGNQANILNAQYNNQLNAWQAQNAADAQSSSSLWGGIGSLAGLGVMALSSKDFKEDKKPVDGALDQVNDMPVEEWRYKKGIADSGENEHIGPYAEDFQRVTGKGNGKAIPVMDAVGVTMKAVQELDRKVDKLAGVGLPARRSPAKTKKPEKQTVAA